MSYVDFKATEHTLTCIIENGEELINYAHIITDALLSWFREYKPSMELDSYVITDIYTVVFKCLQWWDAKGRRYYNTDISGCKIEFKHK